MGKANEFFGMDFSSPSVATAPAPKEEPQGVVGRAMSFFGMDFGATPKGEAQNAPSRAVSGPITKSKFESVFANLIQAESRGKHLDASGSLTASGVGAQGVTQLMPKTAADPGYGVEPVKDKSEKEYLRFGRDYLQALLKEFNGDYPKALAAYNAGPGNVKKAIAKGGESWQDFLPKKSETLPYIKKILGDIRA